MPNIIQGALPFQGGAAALGGAIGGGIGGAYTSAYNSALAQNQAMYNNILQGYQQTAGNQQAAQGQIQAGYNNLTGQVLGDIQGIGASQSQAIQDVYAQQSGAASQDLINRGLGNTTVQNSVQRGLTLDEQKAQIALSNQMAQLTAGYQSQLGLSGLNYQNQANMQNTGLANQQLGWMNTVQMQYPNAQSYQQLLANQGALAQQQAFAAQHPLPGSLGGGGLGGGGFVPEPPASAPAPNWAESGYGSGGGGYDSGVTQGSLAPIPTPDLSQTDQSYQDLGTYDPTQANIDAIYNSPSLFGGAETQIGDVNSSYPWQAAAEGAVQTYDDSGY